MKRAAAVLLTSAFLFACHKPVDTSTSTSTNATATDTRDKTVAEKAFDAGMRARKKAEEIKANEDKKAQETNTAGND